MALFISSTHIIRVTQNVTFPANFNLMPDTEIESPEPRAQSPEPRAQSPRLEASCAGTALAGVSRDGSEQGRAVSVNNVSKTHDADHSTSLIFPTPFQIKGDVWQEQCMKL